MIKRDKKMKYEARYTTKNDLPVLVIKYNVKGFKEEHWEKLIKDPICVECSRKHGYQINRLKEDEGHQIWHLSMEMPMFISTRSVVIAVYHDELKDGSKVLFHSS